jgi:hypothetical protein
VPNLWIPSGDGALAPLETQEYVDEKTFQLLLAENPSLLASALGEERPDARWLLIDRELPIIPEEMLSGALRLDHLFIDQLGTPILLEVKRSSDGRSKREVVGQMLDYASAFAIDWSGDRLRERCEGRCGAGASDELDSFLATTEFSEPSDLWDVVDARIKAGKFSLVFASDELAPSLVRIIDYLNAELRSATVLGVEVVRYADAASELVAYQPVVRGVSQKARRKSDRPERRTVDEFRAVLAASSSTEVCESVDEFIEAIVHRSWSVSIGRSSTNPRLFVSVKPPGVEATLWPVGINPARKKVVLLLQYLKRRAPFDEAPMRADLLERFRTIAPSSVHSDEGLDGAPWFDVSNLADAAVRDELLTMCDWIVDQASVPKGEQ